MAVAGTIEYKVDMNTKKAAAKMRAFEKQTVANATKTAMKVAQRYQTIGNKLVGFSKRVAMLTGGFIGFSIFSKAKQKWEALAKSLRQSSTVSQGTANLEKIRKTVIGLSNDLGIRASDAADAFYQSMSAGFSEDFSHKMTEISSKLSVAATAAGDVMSPKNALDALTTVLNAFGKTGESAKEYADLLNNAVTFGKTSINELAHSISNVAPVASAFGVSLKDVLVAVSALTQSGIDTATATTGMAQMINEMASNSSDVAKAIKENLGMSFAEATKKGMSFTEVLRDGVLPAVKGNAQELINLFANIRAAKTAIPLANANFRLATKVQKGFEKSVDSVNKAVIAAQKQGITQWEKGINKVTNAITTLIFQVGGLGNAIKWLMTILAAVSFVGFMIKIAGLIKMYKALAIAKTAAQTGVGAIGAVPAVLATIGAAWAGLGSSVASLLTLGGLATGAHLLFKGGNSYNPQQSQPKAPPIQNINEVKITSGPYGTSALSNGAKTNAQSNFGSE